MSLLDISYPSGRMPPPGYYREIMEMKPDRSAEQKYPGWLCHPELEFVGPESFNVLDLERWLQENQTINTVTGYKIYRNLQSSEDLVNHLGLYDLLAIEHQAWNYKELPFGYEHRLYGWKSVVKSWIGLKMVPFLYASFDNVSSGLYVTTLGWRFLFGAFDSRDIALRLPVK